MILERFNTAEHYDLICSWWAAHQWPKVPLDHLPGGYVVVSRGKPVCAGFVYFTGTAFCLFEWIVASPESGLKERAQALDTLISGVKLICAQAGVKSVFMSMRHNGLIAKLEKHGFVRTDEGMTNLIGGV